MSGEIVNLVCLYQRDQMRSDVCGALTVVVFGLVRLCSGGSGNDERARLREALVVCGHEDLARVERQERRQASDLAEPTVETVDSFLPDRIRVLFMLDQ